MEEGGEKAGGVKPSPVSPSQTEAKSPVPVWIKAEPVHDGDEIGTRCEYRARTPRGGMLSSSAGTPSQVWIKTEPVDWDELGAKHVLPETKWAGSGFHLPIKEEKMSDDMSGSCVNKEEEEEESNFLRGEVVMRGKDFVVKRDPDYVSDEEVDVKCEVKEESEGGEMEVCVDSSAAMAGASSSTRQTGQSLCPASACLASSGEQAADNSIGRGGGNNAAMMNWYGVPVISGGIPSLPVVPVSGSASGLSCAAVPGALVLVLSSPAVGTTLLSRGTSLMGGAFAAAEHEDSCRGKQVPSSDLRSNVTGPGRPPKHNFETSQPVCEKKHQCPECDKAFTEKGNMNKHIAAKHRDREKFSCSECEKVFSRRNVLDKHVKTVHRGERNFPCLMCGRKFTEESNLISHLATNLRGVGREFPCSECPSSFKTKCGLRAHLADKHADVRNQNPCLKCGKNFSDKGNLKKHVAHVHEGKKNFSCFECGKAFSTKDNRDRHLLGVHRGKKDFACEECGKKFGGKSQMLKHLANVHRK